jgi:hypothetical protein
MSSLQTLELKRCNQFDYCAKDGSHQASLLYHALALNSLSLIDMELYHLPPHSSAVEDALSTLVNLTCVDLSTTLKSEHVAEALLNGLRNSKGIKELNLGSCKGVPTPRGISALKSLLGHLPGLVRLHLNAIDITPSQLRVLGLDTLASLRYLDLSFTCCMEGDAGIALATLLMGMGGLEELRLWQSPREPINDVRMGALLQAFPKLLKLRTLYLPVQCLTYISVPAIVLCLRQRVLPALKVWYGYQRAVEPRELGTVGQIKKEAEARGLEFTFKQA